MHGGNWWLVNIALRQEALLVLGTPYGSVTVWSNAMIFWEKKNLHKSWGHLEISSGHHLIRGRAILYRRWSRLTRSWVEGLTAAGFGVYKALQSIGVWQTLGYWSHTIATLAISYITGYSLQPLLHPTLTLPWMMHMQSNKVTFYSYGESCHHWQKHQYSMLY